MQLIGITTVNIAIATNAWWTDAFQFGDMDQDDFSWSLANQSFLCDIKVAPTDSVALVSLSSAAGTIVIDDVVQRVLHFNLPDTTIRAKLSVTDLTAVPPVNPYVYDLIMVDNTSGARVVLMGGSITVTQGVTLED